MWVDWRGGFWYLSKSFENISNVLCLTGDYFIVSLFFA